MRETVYLLVLSIALSLSLAMEVKLVDGTDRKGDRGSSDSLSYSEPKYMVGPEALMFLNGLCFKEVLDRYEYSVCPFQNITQRRLIGTRSTLLGVWGEWQFPIANETSASKDMGGPEDAVVHDTMIYPNGQSCGRKDRSTVLHLSCEEDSIGIVKGSINEISNCEYSITLGLPLYCGLLAERIVHPSELLSYATSRVGQHDTSKAAPSNSFPDIASGSTSGEKPPGISQDKIRLDPSPDTDVIPSVPRSDSGALPTTPDVSGDTDTLELLLNQVSQLKQSVDALIAQNKVGDETPSESRSS